MRKPYLSISLLRLNLFLEGCIFLRWYVSFLWSDWAWIKLDNNNTLFYQSKYNLKVKCHTHILLPICWPHAWNSLEKYNGWNSNGLGILSSHFCHFSVQWAAFHPVSCRARMRRTERSLHEFQSGPSLSRYTIVMCRKWWGALHCPRAESVTSLNERVIRARNHM